MGSIKSVGGLTRGRGFDNSTSMVWLLSTPACGEVYKAMQDITDLSNRHADELHQDRSKSRIERDSKDLQSILDYFTERMPFRTDSIELRSLSSGIVAEKCVNVDSAELIGTKILSSMDGLFVSQFKFKKKDQVVTLAMYVSLDGAKIEINPQQLYQRLLVAGIDSIDLLTLFQYELCSYPTALFDKTMLMRQANKADLQNGLIKMAPTCIIDNISTDVIYVVDGGALLQRVPWPKSTTYLDLIKLYIQYVHRHFVNVLVVFDGYASGPATKDETHQRRIGKEVGADVDVRLHMKMNMKKKSFLANQTNKQRFLNLLGSELEKESDIQVLHSSSDADYDIVQSACTMSASKSVVVVGEDTDLLILLLYHYTREDHKDMYMQTATKLINLHVMQDTIGHDLAYSLLFIHSLSGCDTTSRPYGIGKVQALEKYKLLVEHAKVFMAPDQSYAEIEKAGQKALAVIYGCKPCTVLDFERATRFSKKVASSSTYIPPERLPPTTDSARFHSRRVYHHVQLWKGNNIDAAKWGWVVCETQHGAKLKPHMMDRTAAPPALLKLIKCNCSGHCNRNTCSCKKNGLNCTLACGNCKGLTCTNTGCVTAGDD